MDEPLDPDGLLDICRVCRCESTPDKPLFHPCVCTGSIKFVHQECLVQWLKYSRKEYCELCKHRYAFTPNEINWNPIEWDRAAEELTWERMESTHYEGLLTTMIGYIVIAFSLVVLYMLCAIARLKNDAPVSELSLELLLLQVVLPALLEQGHTRMWLKGMVRGWTLGMAYILGLRSYLLGDVPINNADNVVEGDQPVQHPAPANLPQPQPGGLGAAHQAMLQGGGPTGFQAYKRPSVFHFRVKMVPTLIKSS
ncbi:DOA10 [Mytilus edulis]|uniref:E3 ubiquitin-protein ligase MARCHF6 n=1 Tax=Mytilus edulis TaxID=6550 RepID=A0A8S3V1H9_MYTED|nr:DOA10 [Mytilus edulis]